MEQAETGKGGRVITQTNQDQKEAKIVSKEGWVPIHKKQARIYKVGESQHE